ALRSRLLIRHGLEQPDGQPTTQSPADLGGAEYGGGAGAPLVAVTTAQLRRAADASGVEEARAAGVDVVALHAIGENTGALHEERTPFVEALLESREVEHGRIRLHLAEVRVDGRVHGDVGRQPVLEVEPCR